MTAVRGFLQTSGLMIRTSRGTDELDGAMLIGYRGNLYTADPDCSVSRSRFGWDAIGCGGRYARGALAAMTETDPLRRVRRTLEVACALNANCRPPFVVLSDPPRKVKR
jgi:ATP-dependent protease HslVU (ClpYQ) peptidase subunit